MDTARHFYERAMILQPQSAVIHLNMAAVMLELGYFSICTVHAKKAMEVGANREKALYRFLKLFDLSFKII